MPGRRAGLPALFPNAKRCGHLAVNAAASWLSIAAASWLQADAATRL
jgi:hypothetical protein